MTRSVFFSAAILLALVGSALAQDLRDQQIRACTGDALRLCSDAIPDEGRVTSCMVVHQAALSPGCLAVFRPTGAKSTEVLTVSTQPRESDRGLR